VAVAPDLSWLTPDLPGLVTVERAFSIRAHVLVAYLRYLQEIDVPFFANRMDFSRVLLVGHSTGGGSCVEAGRLLAAEAGVPPIAYGLIGPYYAGRRPIPGIGPDLRNVLVMHGTRDAISGADAAATYAACGTGRTLVTIPGANHVGYTGLCEPDNTCADALVPDQAGTIRRDSQQRAGSAYLAALLRHYALGDATARPYLTGQREVEGLDDLGVTGVQVQADGL
jgi:predicted dienelactone hydrolase